LLERAGTPANLCIGVRQQAVGLEAHAWVEVGGCIVGRESIERGLFEPLTPIVDRSP
jgi:hypothetical protein